MNKKSLSKLAFSFALIAVMMVLFAGTSTAQKVLWPPSPPPSDPPCPTMQCPNGHAGLPYVEYCEITLPHCVIGCQTFVMSGGGLCYSNCHVE